MATDEGSSPKLAVSEDRIRGNQFSIYIYMTEYTSIMIEYTSSKNVSTTVFVSLFSLT